MSVVVDDISALLEELQIDGGGANGPVPPCTTTSYKQEQIATVEDELKSHFLNPSNSLPWDLLDVMQTVPDMDSVQMYDSLLQLPDRVSRLQYRLKRQGIEGKVHTYAEEVNRSDVANSNAATSISINRAYGESQSLRGSTSQLPFQPGGIQLKNAVKDSTALLHRDSDGLFDIPLGLSRGLYVGGGSLNDLDELENVDDDDEPNEDEELQEGVPLSSVQQSQAKSSGFEKEIDELLPIDINFGRSSMINKDDLVVKKEWAHMVDLDHKIENFHELIPNMARKWPFELDAFQQEAVYHLEQGDSVFVAAHTSAGKTVVAEYAIAMAKRNMTKAIYTSPIKALSNQKFRDFKETFPEVDVGLITGDVQINPEANCLIMTTEILRSMLYRGADLIRDVEFIIFDEVHYVNDISRGVVWEEVIIMLPDHVKYILLSATVPNTYEFASWIGRTKHKDIYVISTPKRPVPLEINLWGKSKLTKVIDADRKFLDSNYNAYIEMFEGKKKPRQGENAANGARGGRGGARGGRGGAATGRGGRGGSQGGRGGRGGQGAGNGPNRRGFQMSQPNKNTWPELIHYLNSNALLPAVIFVFSKARCEQYANTLGGIDFCNAKEKSQIHMFIDKAVARLKKEDRELPQIMSIRDFLSRGIAVHHGGLLPIVKEVIEILFAKSLVKVLFATETFAMGLNLPTKTVVFSELRKHDGINFRNLLPGEFTQMAGRAGRRGLDTIGTVIIMSYTEAMARPTIKDVCLGTATKLVSQFRLTYNMILNLLRIEALRVEEMIKHSFSENTTQALLPEHEKKIKSLEDKLNNLPPLVIQDPFTEDDLKEVFEDLIKYKDLTRSLIKESMNSALFFKQLKPGRVIVFKDNKGLSRIGVIYKRKDHSEPYNFVVLVFDMGAAELQEATGIPYVSSLKSFIRSNFTPMTYNGDLRFEQVSLEQLELVITYYINVFDLGKKDSDALEKFESNINLALKFQERFKEIDWSAFGTLKINELIQERTDLIQKIKGSPCIKSKHFTEYFASLNKKKSIQDEIALYNSLLNDENLELLPDYEQRLAVLKELDFVDENLNVKLKGRVACEINCGWELILTELVLDNFLGDFDPEEIVALLSAFVYEGKSSQEEEPTITPRLERGKSKIQDIMGQMMDVFERHQVTLTSEEQDFLQRNRFALVNVVYEWARGMTFKEIMELSIEAEGTIVRVITRLDEICREVKSAALIIGDSSLHAKMSEAQEKIKRDIVFAASLYL